MGDSTLGPGALDGVRVLDLSGPIGAVLHPAARRPRRRRRAGRAPGRRSPAPDAAVPRRRSGRVARLRLLPRVEAHVVVDDGDPSALARTGPDADVVVVSPSPRSSLPGWDPATLTLAWAPHAIVCAITPFGLTGPNAAWRATPMISYAMGGYMSRVGPVEGPPVTIPGRQCWDEAGVHAAVAVLAALAGRRHRRPAGHRPLGARDPRRQGLRHRAVRRGRAEPARAPRRRRVGPRAAPSSAPTARSTSPPTSPALGRVPRDARPARGARRSRAARSAGPARALRGAAGDDRRLVRDRSREDLVERGQAAGLPCGMLHRPTGFVADRQLASRGTFVATPTPWGEVPMPVPGAGFRSTPSLAGPRTSAAATPGGDDVAWRGAPNDRRSTPERHRRVGGHRVLSFGAFVAGNTTAAILGQLGADVVKIESRTRPEVLRTPAYAYGEPRVEPSGVTNTVMYASLSRSTRDLSVDVATPAGTGPFHRLVAVADVVIENFGARRARGLGPVVRRAARPQPADRADVAVGLRAHRPTRLVPRVREQHLELRRSHLRVGLQPRHAHRLRDRRARRVRHPGRAEQVAATGEGVWIDAAQIEAMAATMPESVLEALVNERDLAPPGNVVAGSLLSGVYRCWATTPGWRSSSRTSPTGGAAATCSTSRSRSPRRPRRASFGRCSTPRCTGGPPSARPHRGSGLQRAGLAAGVVQSSEDVWHDPQLWSRSYRRTRSHNPISARSTTRSRPTASGPRRAASATSVAASAPTPPTCSATGWGWRPTRSSGCSTPAPRSRPDQRCPLRPSPVRTTNRGSGRGAELRGNGGPGYGGQPGGTGRSVAIRLAAEGAKVAITHDPRRDCMRPWRASRRSVAKALCCPRSRRSGRWTRHVGRTDRGCVRPDRHPCQQRRRACAQARRRMEHRGTRALRHVNLWAPWLHMSQVLPGMRARGRGWILNLTSFSGELPPGPPFAFKAKDGSSMYGQPRPCSTD